MSYAVQNFVALNIAEQLKKYQGPIQLIRRTADEMITTEMENLMTNRGNNLLIKVLEFRYPHLMKPSQLKQLWQYLALEEPGQIEFLAKLKIDDDKLKSEIRESDYGSYPSNLGQNSSEDEKTSLLLYLASLYMTNVDSTHCQPLPEEKFKIELLNQIPSKI